MNYRRIVHRDIPNSTIDVSMALTTIIVGAVLPIKGRDIGTGRLSVVALRLGTCLAFDSSTTGKEIGVISAVDVGCTFCSCKGGGR